MARFKDWYSNTVNLNYKAKGIKIRAKLDTIYIRNK